MTCRQRSEFQGTGETIGIVRMGVDEDVEFLVLLLLVIGSLPFVLHWLDQRMTRRDRRVEVGHRTKSR